MCGLYGSRNAVSGSVVLRLSGVLHQIFCNYVQHAIKIGPNQMYSFVKMRGQKDLRSRKRGVNWIENQGEN